MPKNTDKILKNEIEFIISHKESLPKYKINYKIEQILCKYKYENEFMNTENSKTNEPLKFVLILPQKLDLKNSDKYVALQYLSIYYPWKSIRQHCKNNKVKIIAPTWYYEFELLEAFYSVSDIQNYTEYILKNMNHYPETVLFILTSTGLIMH